MPSSPPPWEDGAPLGLVSPHLDDAALSCGSVLAAHPGSHVVTVFSSGPAQVDPLPDWDRQSGSFQPGDDVMALRQVEDDAAMAVVGATGYRLDFWDEQYRAGPPVRLARWRPGAVKAVRARLDDPTVTNDVVGKLAQRLQGLPVTTWLIPLGLWHGDHKKTAAACLRLAGQVPELTWVVYEELPYRVEVPEQVTAARQHLADEGWVLGLVEPAAKPDLGAKRAMLDCYRSQLPCLGDRTERAIAEPEVLHVLRR